MSSANQKKLIMAGVLFMACTASVVVGMPNFTDIEAYRRDLTAQPVAQQKGSISSSSTPKSMWAAGGKK